MQVQPLWIEFRAEHKICAVQGPKFKVSGQTSVLGFQQKKLFQICKKQIAVKIMIN